MSALHAPLRYSDILWPSDEAEFQAKRAAIAPPPYPNLLFVGPPGTGKSSAARVVAFEGIHAITPGVISFSAALETNDLLIVDHSRGLGADVFQGIRDWASLYTLNAEGRRWVLIDEFDSYPASAWGKMKILLDSFKEWKVQVLATTNHLDKIEAAVADRFTTVEMSFHAPAHREKMKSWLVSQVATGGLPAMSDMQIVQALNRSAGSMRGLIDQLEAWRFRYHGLRVVSGGQADLDQ